MKKADRQDAQDALLHAASAALLQLQELGNLTPELEEAVRSQFARMTRLFGYGDSADGWELQ